VRRRPGSHASHPWLEERFSPSIINRTDHTIN
jgi:hypothetical protein